MRFLFWIVAIPLLALAGAFAAVNHQPVTLELWPLPYETAMPVSVAVLGAFAAGVLAAALVFWVRGLPLRLDRRRRARHERALEEEATRLRARLAEAERERGAMPGGSPDPVRRLVASEPE